MALRNDWAPPVLILILMAALAIAILGGGASPLAPWSGHTQGHGVLSVPSDYRTIQAAVDAAVAGDTIRLAAGTYRERVLLNKAVSLSAAAFDSEDATHNLAVVDGGSGEAAILIPAGLSEMPSVHGLIIRGGRDGIEAHSPFVAENNYFYGSQWSVEYQGGSGGVNRSNVYFNSENDAIHMTDFGRPLLIENNRFLYAGDDAIEVDFSDQSAPSSTVEMDIWNNMLIGSSQDAIKFVDAGSRAQDANRKIIVAGNLLANNRRAGIGFVRGGNTNEDYSGADTAEAVRAYNNTFYGNDYGISGGDNLVAFNNIIAATTSRGAWRVHGPAGANSVVAYTLFWGNGVDTDQALLGTGNIFGQDPQFMGSPAPGSDGAWGTPDDDFTGLLLKPGSPAIDKGTAQLMAADGELVPAAPITAFEGKAPDLGWREGGMLPAKTPTPVATASSAAQTPAGSPTAPIGVVPPVTSTSVEESPTAVSTTPGTTGTAITGTPPTAGTPATQTATSALTSTATGSAAPSETATAGNTPLASRTPRAIIQSVSPGSANSGDTLTLTITGSGFGDGAVVGFQGAEGLLPQVISSSVVSPQTILARISIPDLVSGVQKWDVVVSNANGSSAVLKDGFIVNP